MATESDGSDGFRDELRRLVRRLLEESQDEGDPISAAIQVHLATEVAELPVHGEEMPSFELANLQLGLDAALARPGFEARVLGLAGQGRHYSQVGLGDLLSGSQFGLGAPEYVLAPVGPTRSSRREVVPGRPFSRSSGG